MSKLQRVSYFGENEALSLMLKTICEQQGLSYYHIEKDNYSLEMHRDLDAQLNFIEQESCAGEWLDFWSEQIAANEAASIGILGQNEESRLNYKGEIRLPVSPGDLRDAISQWRES